MKALWTWMALMPGLAAAEFLLPLPGEEVSQDGTGIVYQAPPKAAEATRVDFYWSGAVKGDVRARSVGDNLWQARLERMDWGPVSVRAISRDASGKVLSDETVAFRSGRAPQAADPGSVWEQSVMLSGGGGFRGGLSEGTLDRRAALSRSGTGLVQGEASSPLDNQASAWGSSLWQLKKGSLQAKVKISGDLRENAFEQPVNQYAAEASWGQWIAMKIGDQYPSWDPLLMDGTRVRGASVELAAVGEDGASWLRGRLLAGQLRRQTDAWIGWTTAGDTLRTPGTWERQMVGIQLGVGGGENFLASLTVQRTWDVMDGANAALRDDLAAAPPAENVGAALDLHLWGLRRRLELYGNAAMTAVTANRYTRTFADSTRDSLGVDFPSFVTALIPLNSSTRGAQRLLGEDETDWFQANASWRTGIRYRDTWGRSFSLREEFRILHVGEDFESFTRAVRESPRAGGEWNQSLGFLSNRLALTTGYGHFTVPDGLGGDKTLDNFLVSTSFASAGGTTVYLSGQQNQQASDSTGDYVSRGGNVGASQAMSSSAGPVNVRIGYGIQQDQSWFPTTSLDSQGKAVNSLLKNGVIQNSVNGQIRFRPGAGAWEPRLTGQVTHQDLTHAMETRLLLGFGTRLLDRRLDLQFDAGGARQAKTESDRWSRLEQNASASLSIGESSSLRLSQQVAWLNPRMDVRADLAWESFF